MDLIPQNLPSDSEPQALANAKENVPGQQLGLYSDNQEKDICQMTRTLNNPGESSQDDRG